MNWASMAVCDQLIHVVVRLRGQVDVDALGRAVRASVDEQPILGCRFVAGPGAPYWSRREDLDSIRFATVSQAEDVEGGLAEFISTPADSSVDPLISARVIRGLDDVVCFKVNHVVADAAGARDCAYLVASAYSDIASGRERAPTTPRSDRGMSQVWNELPLKRRIELIRAGLRPAVSKVHATAKWEMPEASFSDKGRRMIALQIDEARFRDIRQYCKQKGCTINDALLAAYFLALFEVVGPRVGEPLAIQVTVDLRKYLQDEGAAAICNLGSSLFPVVARKEGQGFEDVLAEVKRMMDGFKAADVAAITIPFLGLQYRLTPLEKAERQRRAGLADGAAGGSVGPLLANMGVIDADRLRFGDVPVEDAYMTAPIAFAPQLYLGASSFRDRLTLSVGFCEEGLSRAKVERILGSLQRELSQAGS